MAKSKKGFQPGNKHGKHGKQPGAGRPPDWFKKKCQGIVERDELVEFMRDVAIGKDFEQSVNDDTGEVIPIPAKIRDRLTAAIYIIERGYGKPAQAIEVIPNADNSGELTSSPARDLLSLAGLLARECSKGA